MLWGETKQTSKPVIWWLKHLFVFSVGTIPSYVKGKLVRIGPGLFTFGKHEANYPMDGMGFLHSFNIADGEVEFQSR